MRQARPPRAPWVAASALLLGLASAWNLGAFDSASAKRARARAPVVALPPPPLVRHLAAGFDALAADLYWIGAAHYFGDERNERVGYAALPAYIELVAELAPWYRPAPRFVGMAMPWKVRGEWRGLDETLRIVERGIRRFPDDWFLRLLLANLEASHRGRFREAADALAAAARLPGCPEHLGPLATRMYVAAHDLEAAEALAGEILAETADESLREAMLKRGGQIRLERALKTLSTSVARFFAERGRLPADLSELVRSGLLSDLPEEPFGGRFVYDPATGRVESTSHTESLLPYEDPKSPSARPPSP